MQSIHHHPAIITANAHTTSRRPLFSIIVLLALGLLAIAIQRPAIADQSPARPPLTIGAILPLSGGASNFGAIARRGIELALEDLSPEDRARVKVIFEDDGLSNMRSATAARKLLTIDKVHALLTWSSGTGLTVASVAEAKKIPHLSIASDPAVAIRHKYSFTYWPIASDEARHLHQHLATTGIKRVAILSQVHNGILAIRDSFLQHVAEHNKLTVVANEEVAGDTTDFRAILERLKAKGEFDAFIPIFFPGQLAVCITQARAVGITAPLFGFETFEDKDEIKAAGGLLTGAVYATGGEPQADFIKRYQVRFPNESYYTANQAYDIVQLFVAATHTRNDGDTIVEFLKSRKDYPTSSGLVSVTVNNQFRLPTVLKQIRADGIPQNL
jgi:branched-chain amino acid transport system substrate-binding protein